MRTNAPPVFPGAPPLIDGNSKSAGYRAEEGLKKPYSTATNTSNQALIFSTEIYSNQYNSRFSVIIRHYAYKIRSISLRAKYYCRIFNNKAFLFIFVREFTVLSLRSSSLFGRAAPDASMADFNAGSRDETTDG